MKKLLLVVSLISTLSLIGCNTNENIENNHLSGNVENQQQIENVENTEIFNINDYVGEYNGQQSSLKLSKVSENSVTLEYSVWQKAYSRLASFKIDTVVIDENKEGMFAFENDGWNHNGEGKIILDKNKITLELYNVASTEQEDNAMWGVVNGTETLYKVEKINLEKELVFNQYESGDVNIPFINLNYDNIKDINSNFESKIELAYADDYLYIEHYENAHYLNDNILSIVGFEASPFGVAANSYDVYNIDITTGKLLSNKDLIKIAGKTEEEVMSSLKEVYLREFINQNNLQESINLNFGFLIPIDDLYSNLREHEIICTEEYYNANTTSSLSYEDAIGFKNGVYKNTLSKIDAIESVEDLQMYLLDENKLEIVATVGGFAGAT